MSLKSAQKKAAIILLSIVSSLYLTFFAAVNFPDSAKAILGTVLLIGVVALVYHLLVKMIQKGES